MVVLVVGLVVGDDVVGGDVVGGDVLGGGGDVVGVGAPGGVVGAGEGDCCTVGGGACEVETGGPDDTGGAVPPGYSNDDAVGGVSTFPVNTAAGKGDPYWGIAVSTASMYLCHSSAGIVPPWTRPIGRLPLA